ncbi:hypothetical protein [Methylobacterium frigidaeris]|uniref:Uncharacterized protein n=1 Tax=Methylobacterium frigidaeris TaxID=2038277 RepID=A0AA37M680_9HYPH|nr:hypothetical protein [Methylobacterium frigidaeris]PIK71543.1 hypothetical protein CS379_18770 [Methylobacterium frigidaeris]GJD64237.1 hypothetical protein MPEAHAMD_4415 [Methylobacterium frigidaeris]
MRAFHRAGLFAAGLFMLAGAACMTGPGRAVAQSDLEMPADPPVLSKPYRSTIPIYRRRPPPDAVPPEPGQPAGSWREPPGRIGARDGGPQEGGQEGAAAMRESPQDSGFGPVKAAPARDLAPHDLAPHDLAPEDDPEERSSGAPVRSATSPKRDMRQETRQDIRAAARPAARDAPARDAPRQTEAAAEDEEEAAPAYAGVWGPSAAACARSRSARRGFLPAVIRPGSARAGKTLCQFRERRRDGRTWTVTAACRSDGRHWTSRVRLTVAGSRLTWASERGSATYTRCSGG